MHPFTLEMDGEGASSSLTVTRLRVDDDDDHLLDGEDAEEKDWPELRAQVPQAQEAERPKVHVP